MAIKKYQKGVRFERQLVNEAREEGLISARTAGSKSPFDLFVIDTENKIIRFIQAKAKKTRHRALNKELDTFSGIYKVRFEVIDKNINDRNFLAKPVSFKQNEK